MEETGVCADRDDVILWLSHLQTAAETKEEVRSCFHLLLVSLRRRQREEGRRRQEEEEDAAV